MHLIDVLVAWYNILQGVIFPMFYLSSSMALQAVVLWWFCKLIVGYLIEIRVQRALPPLYVGLVVSKSDIYEVS